MTKKQNHTENDLSSISISNDRYRSVPVSKYHDLFTKLKPGQRLVCNVGDAPKLKCALDKWLKNNGHKDAKTAARMRCDDGKGGVWWLEKAPASVWRPLQKAA